MRPGKWDLIEFRLAQSVMRLINLFPMAISAWLARRLGELAFLLLSSRRRVALNNLTIAFGHSKSERQRRKIALASFRHLATCLIEFFRLPYSVEVLKRHVHLSGTEYLDQAFARNKGAVLAMSHLGPWEYLGFLPYLKKYPTIVLGRAIKNPYFYRWVQSLRKSLNSEYLDKTSGPRRLLSELKKNHLVAIAIDQWAGNEGLWIDFFGVPTSTTSLPARLAQKTGCALVPAYCIRQGSGRYQIHILAEVPLRAEDDNCVENTTQRLNQLLKEQISAFPEQWVWTHKRWKNRYPV